MMTPEEMQYLTATDIEPVRQFCLTALKNKSKGDKVHYTHLNQQLRTRDDPDLVWKVYLSLTSCVASITQMPEEYTELIQNIFAFDWKMEKKINVAFVNLLSHLISANSIFLIPCLQVIVKTMTLLPTIVPSTTSKKSAVLEHPNFVKDLRELLHRTLRFSTSLVPTGLVELLPVITSNFPYRRHHQEILTGYVSELLKICEYLPVLQPKILDLILEKCLEIDVEIVIEDTGEVLIKPPEPDDDVSGMIVVMISIILAPPTCYLIDFFHLRRNVRTRE
jgi:RNA polymerase I-specific transcription initiation factor RRN3